MLSSNIPSKIQIPFANSASSTYKNTIPQASQIGITNGKASLTDGFPPLTFQPISSGGVPPFGADFNGILYEITAIQQWQEAGGMFPYDGTFSGNIGGYPKGAVLQSADFGGIWVNTTDNNTSDPDTGGAGWTALAFEGSKSVTITSSDVTLTTLQAAYPVILVSGAITAARNLIFPAQVGEWIVQNNTTGAFNLTAKTASGTGVTIPQGSSAYIYCDGTNIYLSAGTGVQSFNGRVGTVTLNSADVVSALGFTPLAPTDFPLSAGASGYQKLSSGMIIQWARILTPYVADGQTTWTYPITFPNGVFGLSTSSTVNGASPNFYYKCGSTYVNNSQAIIQTEFQMYVWCFAYGY